MLKEMIKNVLIDSMKTILNWLTITALILVFFLIYSYFFQPEAFVFLVKGQKAAAYYAILEEGFKINQTYSNHLIEIVPDLSKNCTSQMCIVMNIINWLHNNEDELIDLGEPKGKECKEYAYTFKIISSFFDIDSSICLTDTHAFNLVKVDGKHIFVDPYNMMINDALIHNSYNFIICK